MSCVVIPNIRLAGISAAVPQREEANIDLPLLSDSDALKLIKTTGIERRRIVAKHQCASDLCLAAAEKLLQDLSWDPETIDVLVFVTQTPDYFSIPATAPILQHKLGLTKSSIAFDVTLGCSGFTYGVQIVSSLLSSAKLKRGLLLAGDTLSKVLSPSDKSTFPLFGDAGSACAIELTPEGNLCFDSGTDGSGSSAIQIYGGGARNPTNISSLDVQNVEPGISRNQLQLELDGIDVFNFSLREVPKSISRLFSFSKLTVENIDRFYFHQANLLMNEMIRKKLGIPEEKVPYSLKGFGNTSSASIPLTWVTDHKPSPNNNTVIASGFGVGLSWCSFIADTRNTLVCPLVEVKTDELP